MVHAARSLGGWVTRCVDIPRVELFAMQQAAQNSNKPRAPDLNGSGSGAVAAK
jgi:hypothetical protein